MRSSVVKSYCEEYFHAAATHFTFPKALAKPSKCTHVLMMMIIDVYTHTHTLFPVAALPSKCNRQKPQPICGFTTSYDDVIF